MLRTVQCRPAAACARKSPLRVHSKETRQDKTLAPSFIFPHQAQPPFPFFCNRQQIQDNKGYVCFQPGSLSCISLSMACGFLCRCAAFFPQGLKGRKEGSHGGTYSGFVLETLPGGGLFLCFCCVMLELSLVVVVGREEQRERSPLERTVGEEARCLSIAEG
jgi:hypothetical protein